MLRLSTPRLAAEGAGQNFDEPRSLALAESRCDRVHRRQIGEGVEAAVLGDVRRRPHEPAPGGAGERAAGRNALDAEVLELAPRSGTVRESYSVCGGVPRSNFF